MIRWAPWLACLLGCVGAAPPPDLGGRYLAAIDRDASAERIAAAVDDVGADYERLYPSVAIVRLRATPDQVDRLKFVDGVLAIELIERIGDRSAPRGRPAPAGASSTQITPWGVARVGGSAPPLGDPTLWVLDTGVDLEHEDLNVDASRSIDFVVLEGGDPEPDTTHGTAVAGIAAALDNERDVVGVAPGARVASVRVLDSDGAGTTTALIAGLEHVATHGRPGDVANLSLAARGTSRVVEHAVANVANRGVAVVVAAGNAGRDARDYTPAGGDHSSVYTVSAIDQDDCLSAFSNFGSAVDVAAPGRDIVTLAPGAGTVVVQGTSFAAPHVAGLLLSGRMTSDGTPCDDTDGFAEPIAHRADGSLRM